MQWLNTILMAPPLISRKNGRNILTEKSRENAMVTRFNFTKKMAKYIDKKVMKIQGIFHEKRKWPKIF